jgi:hypothetical protein
MGTLENSNPTLTLDVADNVLQHLEQQVDSPHRHQRILSM